MSAHELSADASESIVAGVRITHPDRVMYPKLGLTKLDVARYYATIGRWILPHVKGRPLTLVQCPTGVSGPCHYLRHSKVWGPSALRRVRIPERKKAGEYLVADSVEAVVSLAQIDVLEIHTWNATTDALEHPDRIVWDLDPGPRVRWPRVVDAARTLRDVLELLNLRAWVKTTVGRGLHVVTPIEPERDWSACLAFARNVAESIERSNPRLFTTRFPKAGRESRILIDYLRNNRTNTSVAAFSTRSDDDAAVSLPITWRNLRERVPAASIVSVSGHFGRRRADPLKEYWTTRQHISERAMSAVAKL